MAVFFFYEETFTWKSVGLHGYPQEFSQPLSILFLNFKMDIPDVYRRQVVLVKPNASVRDHISRGNF